jgi:hypothetical protein
MAGSWGKVRRLGLVGVMCGCARAPDPPRPVAVAVPSPAETPAVPAEESPVVQRAAVQAQAPAARPGRRFEAYPWLADPSLAVPAPADALDERFDPPPGFARVDLPAGSFGAWLRHLPLLPAGTSVLSFRGDVVLPAGHENLAAVVAIDVGGRDLQQCADSVIRLHAEWLYGAGRRDASYRAAAGAAMPFERWARGERVTATPKGNDLRWTPSRRPDGGHAAYRAWLDAVFTWANTGSLARDAQPVAPDDLRPGDFFVLPGSPGHAVLVLDLARAPDGRRALLLGQGFMPAQSFQVLRPSSRSAWFVVEPSAESVATPFWSPFPWRSLRRLDS